RLARHQLDARAEVHTNREVVRAVQLRLVGSVVRQWAGTQTSEIPDIAPVPELRCPDLRIGDVVSREVEERADRRIRLTVVVAVEPFEVAPQTRPAVTRRQRRVTRQR